MKFLLLILLVITGSLNLWAQKKFTILKINGCVKVLNSDNCLAEGDVLYGNETFKFDNQAQPGSAIIMDQSGEILILKQNDVKSASSNNGLVLSFADAAYKSRINEDEYMSRGNPDLTVNNIGSFFGASQFTIIGDEARFSVNPRIYQISKEKYFVLHYKLDTIKISKRLGFRDQTIRIQKNRLLELDGKILPIDKIEDAKLYVYEPAKKTSELLATFNLYFLDAEKLNMEFKNLYLKLADKENKQSKDLIGIFEIYFYESYGKTVPQSLKYTIDEYLAKNLNQ
jgi:hypothetical protein